MLNKILKIAGLTLAATGLVLAAALFTLKRMFPPEKIKAVITEQASRHLKREVTLGEVRVGLFSGISIADFAVSENPDFKKGTFVKSDRFVLKFQILPLLRKKVMVEEIALDAPQITIVRNEDGKTFNFSDLLGTKPAPAPARPQETPAQAEPSALSLTISRAVLNRGRVQFIDKSPQKIKVTLDPINLTVSATGFDKPMSLDLGVGVESLFQGKNVKGTLSAKSVLDLVRQKVSFESLTWDMSALKLSVKGQVVNFIEPSLDLTLSLHDVKISELSAWMTLPKDLQVSGSPKIDLNAKGTLDNLALDLTLDLLKTHLVYGGAFRKPTDTPCALSVQGRLKRQKDFNIESLKGVLAAMEVTLKGTVQNLAAEPAVNLSLQSNTFDVASVAALIQAAEPYAPAGNISLSAKAEGRGKYLQYQGALNADKLRAKADKMEFQDLSGKITFDNSGLDVLQLGGRLAAAGRTPCDFKAQASLKNFSRPDITLNADLSVLDLGIFISDKKKTETPAAPESPQPAEKARAQTAAQGPEIKTQGKITVGKVLYTKFEGSHALATWKLTGVTPVLDKINGAAQFEMKDGKINKIPLLEAIAPVLKADPSGLVYSYMGGRFSVTQGTAQTQDFKVNSPTADLFARGTVHLPSNKPDMTLTAKLPKGALGGTMGDFTNDEEGRPTFVFKLKNDWKPAYDTSQIQKKAEQEIKKKATEVLQNEGQKLLEGLFKK